MRSIGEKPLAYDKVTREIVWAHDAEKGRRYWYPDADCHRQQRGSAYYFQFNPDGGGGRETLMHELAKFLICKHKRVCAKTREGLVYVIFSEAISEEAYDHLKPDVTGWVAESYPRVLRPGSVMHIEVHVTNPVDSEKELKMKAWGDPALEIDLPHDLEPYLNRPVSGDRTRQLLERRAYLELIAIPNGRWIVLPA